MFLDEHINRNFDKLNDNDLHIAHFINTHIDECKNMKIQDFNVITIYHTFIFKEVEYVFR